MKGDNILVLKTYMFKFLIILGASLLSACQVQPLYSTKPIVANSNTDTLPEALKSIDISPPKTRLDQLVRNELQFKLTGGTERTASLPYSLQLATVKSIRSVGISDVDFGPRAFFVTVTSNYVLRDARKAAPIAQGSQKGTASYDRVDQEFTNVRSERDAEIRAAKAAALRLRQALALAIQNAEK